MNKQQFDAILPLITTEVIKLYIQNENADELEAVSVLYKSQLYAMLEREETGVWHYSPMMLYSLLKNELETGVLTLPEGA